MTASKTEQAKELQRQYLKEWRKRNPAKLREYNKTYWERKAARMAAGKGAANSED